MIDGTSILTMSEKVSFRPLGPGEGAVVLTFDTGQLHTCNDSTAAFLALLDGHCTFDMAVEKMSETFDVGHDLLRADLNELVGELMREGIIQ